MRVLVTGYKGQLGFDVIKHLNGREIESVGVDIDDFDLTDTNAVQRFIEDYRPSVVVHCAAYTAVDKAEDDRQTCYAVNVTGTENIVSACQAADAAMVYISTDYVFPGTGDQPYETNSEKGPTGYYGLTKSQGEDAVIAGLDKHFIIRTAWVFGVNGNNFVKTMVRLGREREELRVVADQYGSPTYTDDLARLICDMITTDNYGIYHATNEGFCSWYDFAAEIMKLAGIRNTTIVPVTSEEYPTRAARPKNSRLSKESLDQAGLARLPAWQDALARFLREIN